MCTGLVCCRLAIIAASDHNLKLIVVSLARVVLWSLFCSLLVPALFLILNKIPQLVETNLALIVHFADLVLRDLLNDNDRLSSGDPGVLHTQLSRVSHRDCSKRCRPCTLAF